TTTCCSSSTSTRIPTSATSSTRRCRPFPASRTPTLSSPSRRSAQFNRPYLQSTNKPALFAFSGLAADQFTLGSSFQFIIGAFLLWFQALLPRAFSTGDEVRHGG